MVGNGISLQKSAIMRKYKPVKSILVNKMIEIFHDSWMARLAKLSSENLQLDTPDILYISSEKVDPPDFARAIVSDSLGIRGFEGKSLVVFPSEFFSDGINDSITGLSPIFRGAGEKMASISGGVQTIYSESENVEPLGDIVAIADSILLTRNPRRFARFFSSLRKRIGPGRLVYAPGCADPFNLAFLCYFGIDIVDSFGTYLRSTLGQVIMHGRVIKSDSEEISKIIDIETALEFDYILRHNLRQLESELAVVRDAIRKNELRQLVEMRARHSPWMIEALRYADLEHYNEFEEWVPVTGPEFFASAKESLWRPDIVRYRKRIAERYIPPEKPEILVLLPCSARKPYSSSRTHRQFRNAIRNSGIASAVQEMIITSPLGIVPRELESTYPAAQYDIPVTGHWDEDEKRIAREILGDYLSRRAYSAIIVHLDIEFDFLQDILGKYGATHTGGTDVMSRDNLTKLEKQLASLRDSVKRPSWGERSFEDVRAIASFQFGDPWQYLMKDAVIRGAYPSFRILKNHVQIGSLVPEKGMISLTLEGGRALSGSGRFGVEIDDFIPKTNIFAIGVNSASPEIRTGDEVYAFFDDEVRAVGTARMNGTSMVQLTRGEAIHIRHHV